MKNDKWALVAGAAEGLGAGFCHVLAREGWNLVMVDHNATALESLAGHLTSEQGTAIKSLILDLGETNAANVCLEATESLNCSLLVYIAAYSHVARFLTLEGSELASFLNVNTRTLIHLIHGFASRLIAGGLTGNILLVSSLAGLSDQNM